MAPLQVIEAEDRRLKMLVNGLSSTANKIAQGQPTDVTMLTETMESLDIYPDKLHEGKGGVLFFPVQAPRGVPLPGCSFGGLGREHENGFTLVCALAKQVPTCVQNKPNRREALMITLQAILGLYQNHSWQEGAMVFPMVARVQSEENLNWTASLIEPNKPLLALTTFEPVLLIRVPAPIGFLHVSELTYAGTWNSSFACRPETVSVEQDPTASAVQPSEMRVTETKARGLKLAPSKVTIIVALVQLLDSQELPVLTGEQPEEFHCCCEVKELILEPTNPADGNCVTHIIIQAA